MKCDPAARAYWTLHSVVQLPYLSLVGRMSGRRPTSIYGTDLTFPIVATQRGHFRGATTELMVWKAAAINHTPSPSRSECATSTTKLSRGDMWITGLGGRDHGQ